LVLAVWPTTPVAGPEVAFAKPATPVPLGLKLCPNTPFAKPEVADALPRTPVPIPKPVTPDPLGA